MLLRSRCDRQQRLDPSFIGVTEWSEIGSVLTYLGLAVLFVVIFASNMLLGLSFIPSHIITGEIPYSAHKLRPAFYLVAIVSFGAAIFCLAQAFDGVSVLDRIWNDYWI